MNFKYWVIAILYFGVAALAIVIISALLFPRMESTDQDLALAGLILSSAVAVIGLPGIYLAVLQLYQSVAVPRLKILINTEESDTGKSARIIVVNEGDGSAQSCRVILAYARPKDNSKALVTNFDHDESSVDITDGKVKKLIGLNIPRRELTFEKAWAIQVKEPIFPAEEVKVAQFDFNDERISVAWRVDSERSKSKGMASMAGHSRH